MALKLPAFKTDDERYEWILKSLVPLNQQHIRDFGAYWQGQGVPAELAQRLPAIRNRLVEPGFETWQRVGTATVTPAPAGVKPPPSWAYPALRVASLAEQPLWAMTELGERIARGVLSVGGKAAARPVGWLTKQIEIHGHPELYAPVTSKVAAYRARNRAALYQRGIAQGIAGDLAESITDFLGLAIQLGLTGKAVPPAVVPSLVEPTKLAQIGGQVGRMAAHGMLTTSGTVPERAMSTATRIANNLTGYVANATGAVGIKAQTIDTLLNMALSHPVYTDAIRKAGGMNREALAMLIPQLVMDIGFAWQTRGLPENQARAVWSRRADVISKSKGPAPAGVDDLMRRIQAELGLTEPAQAVQAAKPVQPEPAKPVQPVQVAPAAPVRPTGAATPAADVGAAGPPTTAAPAPAVGASPAVPPAVKLEPAPEMKPAPAPVKAAVQVGQRYAVTTSQGATLEGRLDRIRTLKNGVRLGYVVLDDGATRAVPLGGKSKWEAVARAVEGPAAPPPAPVPAEPVSVRPPEAAPAPTPGPPRAVKILAAGGQAQAMTERGTRVDTRYHLVDAGELVSSHDSSLRPDGRFPAELQPRDRTRAASEEQVNRIARKLEPGFLGESPKASEGAPVVGPDLIVESGNARVIALKRAYEQKLPGAEKYRAWLAMNADRFGLDAKAVQEAAAPVLVRVRETDVDRVRFVAEANEQAVAAMSATEQAAADAKRLTGDLMKLFAPTDEGEVLTPSNRDFIAAFMRDVVGPTERGRYVSPDGAISQEGVARVRNAVFARAYGDVSAIERLAESTDNNVRNITGGMLVAAPRLADVKERIAQGRLFDLDVTGDVAQAVEKLSALRAQGQALEAYLQQKGLFGEEMTPLAKDVLAVLDRYSKSRKKVAEVLTTYAELVEAVGDPSQGVLFGERRAPRKDELLQAAVDAVEAHYVEPVQAALFQAKPLHGKVTYQPAGEAPAGQAPTGPAAGEGGGAQPALGPVEEALASEVDRAIPPAAPAAGLSVRIEGGVPRRPAKPGRYAFTDPDTEARFQAAHGIPEAPFRLRVRQWVTDLRNKATREFEHLPHTAEFAPLRFDLLKLQKQRDVAADRTLRVQQAITVRMAPDEYDLFTRKVVLDDLAHEAGKGKKLPFGFTADTLNAEKARIDRAAAANPTVDQAVKVRRVAWAAIKADYVKAMEDIGFHVEDRLKNEDYFRHQVLEYARLRGVTGRGQKLRTPAGRGFLKQRAGSELDINTDYMQAEFEVMGQMLHDVEVAKTIKGVDARYNVRPRLEDLAKRANEKALARLLTEEGEGGPAAQNLSDFRQKIAIGLSKLRKLAVKGALPSGDNGEYESTLEGLREQGEAEELLAQGLREEDIYWPQGLEKTELFQYLRYLLDQGDEGAPAAGMVLKAVSQRREFVKETLGDAYKTWRDLVPEGYATWQPREGSMLYLADSVPAHLADKLRQGVLERIGLAEEDLRKVLAIAGPREEFVVKEEVAATLDNLTRPPDTSTIARASKALVRPWKVWTLISPKRWSKYNARNTSGDAEAVFVGNPSAFRKVPQAIRELYQVYFGDRAMTPEMREWFKRGGMQTLLQVQELGDIDKLRMFQHLQEAKGTVRELPVKAWQAYWKAARLSTDFREGILRYAAYLDYLGQMQASPKGRPRNFGASIPEEIQALADVRDRAFMLSNQLLGAYDQVSALGQEIRQHLAPFWSWQEVNFKRYVQLAKNAARDPDGARLVGRALVVATPRIAFSVGKFALKAVSLWAVLSAWNHTFYPEEERDLPPEIQGQPHIVLGRDAEGKVRYFNRLGMLPDFLEWFGLDEAPRTVEDWLNGKRTLKEIAVDMAKAPINKAIQQLSPLLKTPFEAFAKRTLYPDAFQPGNVRDRGLYIAKSLGLDAEYRKLAGLPSRPYGEAMEGLAVYKSDPGEAAYYAILDEKYRYMRKLGKATQAYVESERSNILYNLKQALRYGDKRAADNYLQRYALAGGTKEGMDASLKSLHPLYGLNQAEQTQFAASLVPEDQVRLAKAVEHYNKVLAGAVEINTGILPRKARSSRSSGAIKF